MKKIFVLLLSVLLFPMSLLAADTPVIKEQEGLKLAENAKSAILIEASTGDILYEKNSHQKLVPASMTKMMSMLLIVEAVERGSLSWDTMVTVSENASRMGGSQILLETGEKMSVQDLFKGIAVASGNDAVVAMAEKIAGTESAFVQMMNKRAQELGLKDTHFKNPHGLDEADHYSSAYDMAMIGLELVKHPVVLTYTSIYEDYLRENTDRKYWLVNTNRLVRFYEGVDGLKTGYTEEAGYCLTATAKKENMRLVAVGMGEPESNTRSKEMTELLDYGFAQYQTDTILTRESVLGKQEILKGKQKYVDIVPVRDVTVLNKKVADKRNVTYEIKVNPIKAPIAKGDIVGSLVLMEKGTEIEEIPLTVSENVQKANLLELYWRYLKDILNGTIAW